MRPLLAAAAGLLVTFAAPHATSAAQIPGIPSGSRFEIAEVRGLADVPSRADAGFSGAAAGPSFASGTHAVIVKFQTSTPPQDSALTIGWLRKGKGAPVQISTSQISASDLGSGAYAMLTSSGNGLEPGNYQVSLQGSGGKIYRTVEFAVLAPPPAKPKPTTNTQPAPGGEAASSDDDGVALVPYALGQLGFDYPAYYSVYPLSRSEDNGVLLMRGAPFGGLYVVVRKEGRYNFEKEVRDVWFGLQRAKIARAIVAINGYDIARGDIGGGHVAVGKLFVVTGEGDQKLNVAIYQTDVNGQSVLLGYISALTKPSATPTGTSASETTANDFFRMVRSMRAPAPAARPEAPTSDPPAPARPSEVSDVD